VNQFEATVSALSYSILRERCPGADEDPGFPHNRCARFVLEQHGRMPDYLRLPFAALTRAFGASALLRHGRPFHRLPHAARWSHIETWRNAPFGPCRDLVRFYESFVIFHWHSVRAPRPAGPPPHAVRENGPVHCLQEGGE
jgi:hypothetical protein